MFWPFTKKAKEELVVEIETPSSYYDKCLSRVEKSEIEKTSAIRCGSIYKTSWRVGGSWTSFGEANDRIISDKYWDKIRADRAAQLAQL